MLLPVQMQHGSPPSYQRVPLSVLFPVWDGLLLPIHGDVRTVWLVF